MTMPKSGFTYFAQRINNKTPLNFVDDIHFHCDQLECFTFFNQRIVYYIKAYGMFSG